MLEFIFDFYITEKSDPFSLLLQRFRKIFDALATDQCDLTVLPIVLVSMKSTRISYQHKFNEVFTSKINIFSEEKQ